MHIALSLFACTSGPTPTDTVDPTDEPTPVPTDVPPPVPTPPPSPEVTWSWQNPLPYGGTLRDVWADASTHRAWAVGVGRTLDAWDGSAWTRVGLPLEDELSLPYYEGYEPDYEAIFGWSADQLVVGTSYGPVHWDGAALATPYPAVDYSSPTPRHLWGADPDYVLGTWGQSCFFWDGASWTWLGCSYEVSNYNGVWGTGYEDIFVAAHLGELHHYDGTDWSTHEVGPLDELYAVWTADAASAVWVVGEEGRIHAFDRTSQTFTSFDSGVSTALLDLWGAAADDVWAVGEEGVLLHWDGASWSTVATGTSVTLHAVFGAAADDVWVVGGGGTRLHYDGSTWTRSGSGATDDLRDIHVVDAQTAWAVGGRALLTWDGTSWTRQPSPVDGARAVAGSGPSDVWVAGPETLHHFDGTAWSEDTPDELELWGLDSGGGRTVAIGYWALWERTPSGWTEVRSYGWPGGYDVSVSPDGYAFALGSGGADVSAPGAGWQALPDIWDSVSTIHGTSTLDVWIAGHDGILHLENGSWVSHSDLYEDAPQLNVSDVWGTGPDDVWAVTDRGFAFHWDGEAWTKDMPVELGVAALDGLAGTGVWMAAQDGAILFRP